MTSGRRRSFLYLREEPGQWCLIAPRHQRLNLSSPASHPTQGDRWSPGYKQSSQLRFEIGPAGSAPRLFCACTRGATGDVRAIVARLSEDPL